MVYARGHRPKAAANTAATCTEPNCPVTWQGGPEQHTPHVYLLLWGPNWTGRSQPGGQRDLPGELLLRARQQPGAGRLGPRSPRPYADSTGVPAGCLGWCIEGVTIDTSVPPPQHQPGPARRRGGHVATEPRHHHRHQRRPRSSWLPSRAPARRASPGTVCTGGTRIQLRLPQVHPTSRSSTCRTSPTRVRPAARTPSTPLPVGRHRRLRRHRWRPVRQHDHRPVRQRLVRSQRWRVRR